MNSQVSVPWAKGQGREGANYALLEGKTKSVGFYQEVLDYIG